MPMQYAYSILYVADVVETIDFYKRAFGFDQKFVTPEKDYGELKSGETTIAFASLELGRSNFKRDFVKSAVNSDPFGVELAFTTDTIQADFQRAIDVGAVEFTSFTRKPWGQPVGYVRDDDGFLIEICTPIKPKQ